MVLVLARVFGECRSGPWLSVPKAMGMLRRPAVSAGKDAVAEVALGGGAGADCGARGGDLLEFWLSEMNGVDERGARGEDAVLRGERDGRVAVFGEAGFRSRRAARKCACAAAVPALRESGDVLERGRGTARMLWGAAPAVTLG